ncbi:hypothetical protein B484DRAFT_88027 [Ochromonadaceae sp. CCMP2298]|nr:hypothetical protein B484DRAFT_88027 [Ochromonadaceae sp. CCMP2298]
MAVAFDPRYNICIFGSESEALSVKVDEGGNWLTELINLDIDGEVMRLGAAHPLQGGSFDSEEEHESARDNRKYELLKEQQALHLQTHGTSTSDLLNPNFIQESVAGIYLPPTHTASYGIHLHSGIELKSYSLTTSSESTQNALASRCVHIRYSPVRAELSTDLIGDDLKVLPRVLATIDRAWASPRSLDTLTGATLAERLTRALTSRKQNERHKIDLIIGGAEVSLWMAEQFASDLRCLFYA